MKKLFKFRWNCGRMGEVEGLFISTTEELESFYDKELYFGEILGKHSEIFGTLEREDITVLSEDQEFLGKMEEILGDRISGYCPMDYLWDYEDEEEDEEDE